MSKPLKNTAVLLQSRRALTLIELLVAVAALTLIALGLSRVFSATGKTLRAGRQISRLNEYGAMIERQLRSDFEQMSRDGFLLIRHRLANNGQPIPLWEKDPTTGRARRADELVFFKQGQFTSLRDPVNPARQARGPAARIYIGHGLPYNPDGATFYDTPRIDRPRALFADAVDAPSFGQTGPSQYAQNWTLLRHVAVLSGSEPSAKKANLSGGAADGYPDNDWQVDWQPAARSIFRFEAETAPASLPTPSPVFVRGANQWPIFASGMVDVATTDLREIRARILDAWPYRTPIGTTASFASASTDDDNDDSALAAPTTANQFDGQPVWAPDQAPGTLTAPDMNSATRRMQAWMTDALPADSDAGASAGQERRMRCEAVPPDYLGTLGAATGTPGIPFDDGEWWRRTDQLMLASSNFVPNCTEFIVEWSFGNIYPTNLTGQEAARRGQLVWHGLPRNAATSSTRIIPYLNSAASSNEKNASAHVVSIISNGVYGNAPWLVTNELIHYLPRNLSLNQNSTLYSCFGYLDPVYSREKAWMLYGSSVIPAADKEAWKASMPTSIEWAWPKFIRITMTLADPQAPGVERTFEFVFDVPQRTAE